MSDQTVRQATGGPPAVFLPLATSSTPVATTRPPADLQAPTERLVATLLATPPAGVCVLDTPAGFGCSSLMAAAAGRVDCPVISVPLTGRDAERPLGFWLRLVDALGFAGVDMIGVCAVLGRGASDGPTDDDQWHDDLVSTLLAALREAGPLVLVLDDLDYRRDVDLVPPLIQVLEGQPPTCRTFLRVRHGVPLGLAHLLSSGRMVHVTGEAMTLTSSQARSVLDSGFPNLTRGVREGIVEAAGGWIAALVGAARAATVNPDEDGVTWLTDGGLDLVFEAEMEQLSPDESDLLTGSSVLDTLTSPACNALLERKDSHAVLGRLSRGGLMLSALGGRPRGHRVHPLFREFLRRRLELTGGPSAVDDAHRAAATHFLATGDTVSAIKHLLEAGDVQAALQFLGQRLAPLMDSGQVELVRQVYRHAAKSGSVQDGAVPADAPGQDVLHLLGAVWSELLTGDHGTAEQHLHLLDECIETLPVDFVGHQRLVSESAFAHAVLEGYRGYPARALELTTLARSGFGDGWERLVEQSTAFHSVRLLLWQNDLGAARSLLTTVRRRPGTREFHRSHTVPALSAWLVAAEGRAHRGRFLATQALRARPVDEVFGMGQGIDSRLALAQAMTDLDLLDEALEHARCALDLANRAGHVAYRLLALLHLATVHAGRRADHICAELISQAGQIITAVCPGSDLVGAVEATQARVWLELGERTRAQACARRMGDGIDRHVLLGRAAAAPTMLKAAQEARRLRPHTPRQHVDLRLLMAAAKAAAAPDEARVHLLAAAETAHELGMRRALVAWPEQLQVLAERTAEESGSAALADLVHVAQGRRSAGVAGSWMPALADEAAHQVPGVRLSRGERELVEALAMPSGCGNVALADHFGVSVNTVKTRLRRLYRKLGAHTRHDALRRAEALGLRPSAPAPASAGDLGAGMRL